jgi:hypothetical protein
MNESINMKFTVSELNLILEGLGNMAYYRVHELIHKIHSQAQEQVNSITSASASNTDNAPPPLKTANGIHAD